MERHGRSTAAGWTVVHLTVEHLRDPRRLVDQVRAAMAQTAPSA